MIRILYNILVKNNLNVLLGIKFNLYNCSMKIAEENKKLYVKTYGCQMNVYDSLRLENIMKIHGYSLTEDILNASVIFLNTCNIRAKAVEKLYSELGRIFNKLKDKDTKPIIAVAGCVGQAEGEEVFKRAPYVNIIVGPQSYVNLPSLILDVQNGKKHALDLDFIDHKKFDNLPTYGMEQGVSSFVSIQEGCDKFCHFCVVPFTRGPEFSRNVNQVHEEVLNSVKQGSKEVILLGQNVSAYHGQGPNGEEFSIADLIRYIANIEGLMRIRYTTSHPIDITDDLINLHSTQANLMPFLHLPFQSGSNAILSKMNRKYTKEQYLELIDKFRSKRPDMSFSTDIIVGYPEESCEDFADTLDLVQKVGFAQCYSFKYSPRPGTVASVKKQVPEEEKNNRLYQLQDLILKQQAKFNQQFIDKSVNILVEGIGSKPYQVKGRSEYFQPAYLNSDKNLIGSIVKVKVKEANYNNLFTTLDSDI